MRNKNSKIKIIAAVLVCVLLEIPVTTRAEAVANQNTVRFVVAVKPGRHSSVGRILSERTRDQPQWRVVEVPAAQAARTQQQVAADPSVADVHEAQIYHAALTPNDSRLADQYALPAIHAPAAWEVTTGSAQTVIAIVDGGVDLAHEDLADKIWVNPGEIANNSLDDDSNGYVDDVHGWDFVTNKADDLAVDHATHVAGIAAAASNNNQGMAGVDWQARLLSVRVLAASGAGFEDDIIAGINYAVRSGASVINLSLVGPASPALSATIANAYTAGVVVVAAAGNSGVDTTFSPVYPACADVNGVDMVIGVAATDDKGEPASFSNYGSCVNIAAPGDSILSTKTNNRYGKMTGTSMSSPLVAGVAGLYKALHPAASPAEVIAAVSHGAAFTGKNAAQWNTAYKGKLDAALVVGAPPEPSPTPSPTPQPSPVSDSGSGGGGSSGDGGGGGGGSEEPQPTLPPVKKGHVKGITSRIPSADRHAPDFIQNRDVPAIVRRLFSEIFGRRPNAQESIYWKLRARSDKATLSKLRGAMAWGKIHGLQTTL